jgi:hypothetical protein
MARIAFDFREHPWASVDLAPHAPVVVRLRCGVQFESTDGTFTKLYRAIVDTGAPVSVIPRRLWTPLSVNITVPSTTLGGISKRPECRVPARFGTVRGRLADTSGTTSDVLEFPAYLAETDEVPLLVGFAGLLAQFRVCFDHRTQEAWADDS